MAGKDLGFGQDLQERRSRASASRRQLRLHKVRATCITFAKCMNSQVCVCNGKKRRVTSVWGCRGPPGAIFLKKPSFLAVFGLRSGPDGSRQAVGFIWSLLWAKPSILDPFRTKFNVFGPDPNFGQPGLDLGRSWPTLANLGPRLGPILGRLRADLWLTLGSTFG